MSVLYIWKIPLITLLIFWFPSKFCRKTIDGILLLKGWSDFYETYGTAETSKKQSRNLKAGDRVAIQKQTRQLLKNSSAFTSIHLL